MAEEMRIRRNSYQELGDEDRESLLEEAKSQLGGGKGAERMWKIMTLFVIFLLLGFAVFHYFSKEDNTGLAISGSILFVYLFAMLEWFRRPG